MGHHFRKAVQMLCLDEGGTKLIGSCMQARQGGMAAAQRIMLTAQPRPLPISLPRLPTWTLSSTSRRENRRP